MWEAYGRGGAHSCVRNAHTYGVDNIHGILSLFFLEKLARTHTCTQTDQRILTWKHVLDNI